MIKGVATGDVGVVKQPPAHHARFMILYLHIKILL